MDAHVLQAGLAGSAEGKALRNAAEAAVGVLLLAQRELRPTPAKSHYLFNLRDVARVVEGLQRIGPVELGGDADKVVRLLVHEVARVFSDRLTHEEDQRTLHDFVDQQVREKMRVDLFQVFRANYDDIGPAWSIMAKTLLFTDLRPTRQVLDEVLPSAMESQQRYLSKALDDFNANSAAPLSIMLFDYAVMHLLRICRVLKMPQGHVFLIGLGGTGRQSLTRLAASLCDHSFATPEQPQSLTEQQWRDGLRAHYLRAGLDGVSSVYSLPEACIRGDYMLDDINNLLNSGRVPNLLTHEERLKMLDKLRAAASQAGRRDLAETGSPLDYEDFFAARVRQHLRVVLAMSPVGGAIRERIRNFPALVNCCTIDWFMRWPDEALEAVSALELADADLPGEHMQLAKACRVLHQSAEQLSLQLLQQKRHLYVTPTSYLELL